MPGSGFFDRAMGSLLERVTAWLPSVAAALIVLLAGAVMAYAAAAALRTFLKRIGLDELIGEGLRDALEKGGVRRGASELLSSLLFWMLLASAFVVALDAAGLDLSLLPVQSFVAYLPRAMGAVAILVGGAILAGYGGTAATVALAGFGVDFHRSLGRVVQVLLLTITGIATLEQLGLDVGVLVQTFTSLVAISAAGLALSFALGGRDVAKNVLAGHYARDQFPAGARLEVEGRQGTLEGIGSISAEIRTPDGSFFVPNARLTDGTVRVWSTELDD